MEVEKGSLPSNAITGGGVTLDGFASRYCEAGGTVPGQDAGGAELPQQNLGSAPHGLSGGSGTVAAHGLQPAVKVDVGVAQVDMAEDMRQRRRRQGK